MKRLIQIPVLVLFGFMAVSFAKAQEVAKPAKEPCEMLMGRILVLDPDGHPLNGATVTPKGLRTNVVASTAFGWNEESYGRAAQVVTPIAEDGTFEFESLPSGEVLQMIPICDDWVAKRPGIETVLRFFPGDADKLNSRITLPQLIELRGELARSELEMEPASSVRVAVKITDGKPLAGALVVMSPNHLWFKNGGNILGGYSLTRDYLVSTRKGEPTNKQTGRFEVNTDDQGVALSKNLPANGTYQFSVYHDDFELPVSGDYRLGSVELKPGGIAEVMVQMQKKGTEVIGDGQDDRAGAGKEQDDGDGIKN